MRAANTTSWVLVLLIGCAMSPFTGAEDGLRLKEGTTIRPAPSPTSPPAPDCRPSSADPRCRPQQAPRAYPYYRRPVIIHSTPPAPPLDISTLSDDWEGCRAAKLNAMHSRNDGQLEQANRLDEWLWKNCRSYSQELRELEQGEM